MKRNPSTHTQIDPLFALTNQNTGESEEFRFSLMNHVQKVKVTDKTSESRLPTQLDTHTQRLSLKDIRPTNTPMEPKCEAPINVSNETTKASQAWICQCTLIYINDQCIMLTSSQTYLSTRFKFILLPNITKNSFSHENKLIY